MNKSASPFSLRATPRAALLCILLLIAASAVYCGASRNSEPTPTPAPTPSTSAIVADHKAAAAFDRIPAQWLETARRNLKMYYGHTSHGSQITLGLQDVETQHGSAYNVAITQGSLPSDSGAFAVFDASTYDWSADFYPTVAGVLNSNPQINVVMYMWCGQHSGLNWKTTLDTYVADMQSLEQRYPNVRFIYATGNAMEQDCPGCLREQFNEGLRQFAADHKKLLFDFGALTSLPGTVVGTNPEGSTNLDIAVTADGKFVYTLNSVAGALGIFAVQKDGTLLNVGFAGGVSPLSGFNGIAAF